MNKRRWLDLIFSVLLFVSLSTHLYFYLEFQARTQKFMSVGKCFTARDGQEICERLRVVETMNGLESASCLYDR